MRKYLAAMSRFYWWLSPHLRKQRKAISTSMAMRHGKPGIYRDLIDFNETAFSAGGIAGFRYFISPRWCRCECAVSEKGMN
jgi:hypothetical protein